ncbi:MAG: hypothetical protein QF535_20155, partial [Anaerolineales bacterium]|nr:hypothetical protein [Anaerolineales bacterium]
METNHNINPFAAASIIARFQLIFRNIGASRFGVADESTSEPQYLQKLASDDITLPHLSQYIIALLLAVIRLHF